MFWKDAMVLASLMNGTLFCTTLPNVRLLIHLYKSWQRQLFEDRNAMRYRPSVRYFAQCPLLTEGRMISELYAPDRSCLKVLLAITGCGGNKLGFKREIRRQKLCARLRVASEAALSIMSLGFYAHENLSVIFVGAPVTQV
jgi:hypothetical protein